MEQNINRGLTKTRHTSPSRATSWVWIAAIMEKIDHILTAPHYMTRSGIKDNNILNIRSQAILGPHKMRPHTSLIMNFSACIMLILSKTGDDISRRHFFIPISGKYKLILSVHRRIVIFNFKVGIFTKWMDPRKWNVQQCCNDAWTTNAQSIYCCNNELLWRQLCWRIPLSTARIVFKRNLETCHTCWNAIIML